MTGLDLESFLLLLRADLTTWMVLGLTTLGLAVLVWSSWRSRRALRNCLVLSLAAHLGLVLYGSTIPAVMWTVGQVRHDAQDRSHIRQIRVSPLRESNTSGGARRLSESGQIRKAADRWDVASAPFKLADASLKAARPKLDDLSVPFREPEITPPPLAAAASAVPQAKDLLATPPESRPELVSNEVDGPSLQPRPSPPALAEVDQVDRMNSTPGTVPEEARRKIVRESSLSADPALANDRRLRPVDFGRTSQARLAKARRAAANRDKTCRVALQGQGRQLPAYGESRGRRCPGLVPKWLESATPFRWLGRLRILERRRSAGPGWLCWEIASACRIWRRYPRFTIPG